MHLSWTPIVFLRYCFFLVLGILVEVYFSLSEVWIILTSYALLLYLTFFIVLKKHQKFIYKWIFGCLGLIFLLSVGGLITYQRTSVNNDKHILNSKETILYYRGIVDSEVLERNKTYKSELRILSIKTQSGWSKAQGRVLIYQPKHKSTSAVEYGDEMIVKGAPQEIPKPSNPGDFDYKTYAAHHNIYHQHFIKVYSIISQGQGNPVIQLSLNLRNKCDVVFKKYIPTEREYGITSALILGVKSGLDNEIKDAYANAGIMHILAVSGMHVALIFEILILALGRIKKVKYGNYLFALVVLSCIWLFAFITGLSASVLRAAVMFSFILIGEVTQRQKSVYNNFFLSAFVLLVYNPYLIFDVGFQLSYLAVLGITYLYPKIYNSFKAKSTLADYLNKIIAMSMAAQVITAPLSVFYFHQFPSYFLIANLVLIPVTTIAVYLGISLLMFSIISPLANLVGLIIKWLLWGGNQFVLFTVNLPFSTIHDLKLSSLETLCIYLAIVLAIVFFNTKRLHYMKLLLVVVLVFSVSTTYSKVEDSGIKSITVYKGSDKIQMVSGKEKILLNDSSNDKIIVKKFSGIQFFTWNFKVIAIVDSSSVTKNLISTEKLMIDFLILQDNAKVDIGHLSTIFDIGTIIIDDNNSKRNMERIMKKSRELGINSYCVYNKGAFHYEF